MNLALVCWRSVLRRSWRQAIVLSLVGVGMPPLRNRHQTRRPGPRPGRTGHLLVPQLPAVKNNRVYILSDWYVLQPGSHVGELAEKFAEILHPNLTTRGSTP